MHHDHYAERDREGADDEPQANEECPSLDDHHQVAQESGNVNGQHADDKPHGDQQVVAGVIWPPVVEVEHQRDAE